MDLLEAPKLNNKGQFSIIAALLVAIVLVASVTATYATIRYNPIQDQTQILSAIDETNLALKQILGFTIGYYGSVLQVTGNSSYAQTLATNYFHSGLENLADINPEWGASFNVANLSLGTNWFTNASYSEGRLNVTYDLTGLGINGLSYSASCRLGVQISPSSSNNQVCLTVTKDENEPLVSLSSSSFKFYLYDFTNSNWGLVNPPDDPVSSNNGTYIIDIPIGINPQSYFIQVKDSRGIMVAASSFSHYTGSLRFNSTLQSQAATVAVELLQNGTMRWLGQNLQLTTQTVSVPPVPMKAIHINETIDGVNQQVPFQIEDWASSYTVPLGLTSNTTVFGNRQMIVFLVNTHVSDFTLWWNGSDQAIQTSLAYTNKYFTSDNPNSNLLSNGKLKLQFSGSFDVTSTVFNSGTSSTATFMRINNQHSTYGSGINYVVYKGVVRDIVQQEAEWVNGATNCPNLYANIVLTLPANATYFTYQLSLMFINSQPTRTIADLCPIALSSSIGQLQTENGTVQGDPVVALGTQTLSNSIGTWEHHWSQFTDGTKGAGIMFTDLANQRLYTFDTISPATARGALKADSSARAISLLPVTLNSVSFQSALDVSWYGAIVTFDASVLPIYGGSGQPGLWILADLPPPITATVGN